MRFLASKPELDGGALEIARAYVGLSTCRAVGMSVGPIPMTAVWAWEDRNGITRPPQRRWFESIFASIDARMMKRANRPSPTTNADSKHGGLPVPNRRRRNARR